MSSEQILVACMGYRFQQDQSVGPALIPRLENEPWPPGVEILDLHFGPIHMVHWLQDRTPPLDRVVFLAAESRDRLPGGIYAYRWKADLPDDEEVQARVGEAVSGVINLDNMLIVTSYFKVLPEEVYVVEVEPVVGGWGASLSPEMEAAIPRIVAAVRRAALEPVHG